MAVTIYHNPRCSKSRKTLQLLGDSGVNPTIVLYLEDAPSAARILEIAKQLGSPVSALVRQGEDEFKDATDLPDLSDNPALADWLSTHPVALQRPIVVNAELGKAVIGRPPENVLELLD